MLGLDLCAAAKARGEDVVALSRAELDVTDEAAVAAVLGTTAPEVVFNCAAWTDVDGAESEPEAALAVNGAGAGNVAAAAAAQGAHVIQVSTDYVFDGSKTAPYVESDPTGPRSRYGIGKLAGERAVALAAPGSHTIVRTSWLFGTGGSCFPKTILRLARERDELTVVADQLGCPTYTGHLAEALLTLARTRPAGIIHVAGRGECSWHELATAIVAAAGLTTPVLPGRSADLKRAAPRPAYSVLGTERAHEVPPMPHWQEGLNAFMEQGVAA
jgi:dTDP-4-dehydrorhamnose reductase